MILSILPAYFNDQLVYAASILLAAACGAAIGMERKSRFKEAGFRTHLIVATAAALMMVISKYGFYDVISDTIKLDPSRIGAGIVTAVSFLGAGIIFMRKDTIIGLTTAAGLWATVGVGMAAGSGMYFLAIFSTALILLVQTITHRYNRVDKPNVEQSLIIKVRQSPQAFSYIEDVMSLQGIEILSLHVSTDEQQRLEIDAMVRWPDSFSPASIFKLMEGNPDILSIEL